MLTPGKPSSEHSWCILFSVGKQKWWKCYLFWRNKNGQCINTWFGGRISGCPASTARFLLIKTSGWTLNWRKRGSSCSVGKSVKAGGLPGWVRVLSGVGALRQTSGPSDGWGGGAGRGAGVDGRGLSCRSVAASRASAGLIAGRFSPADVTCEYRSCNCSFVIVTFSKKHFRRCGY